MRFCHASAVPPPGVAAGPSRKLDVCLFVLQFKEISAAYEVLSDQKKRRIYDEGGEQALKEGGGREGFSNAHDIFDMFFGEFLAALLVKAAAQSRGTWLKKGGLASSSPTVSNR